MSPAEQFVHLHVHTEYSMLDGAARLTELFAEAQRMGMPAIAMTDHGNVFGAYDFWSKAKAAGIKPIIGCLLAGQEIVTDQGVKAVEDIAVGDLVLTHRGRFRRVTRTMERSYRGRAYTISIAGRYGRTLTLTEEHPILVRTRDGIVDWRKPGDIRPGRPGVRGGRDNWNSWVCLPRLEESTREIDILAFLSPDFGINPGGGVRRSHKSKYRADSVWPAIPRSLALNFDLGYLLGIYAAEGHVLRRDGELTGGIGLTFSINEHELFDRVESLFRRFGAEVQSYARPDRGSRELRTCSVPLAHLLSQAAGSGAHNKRVPPFVLSGSSDVRRGFLAGVLDGDGKSLSAPSNIAGKRDLKTVSAALAWGVRTLLADEGYWATVSSGTAPGTFPQGMTDRTYRYFNVAFQPNRTYARTIADREFVYRPVSSVTPVELVSHVYNFEVEEDNSYVSDFVLHNCEAYVTPNTPRGERTRVRWASGGENDVSGGGAFTHMTLLSESTEGMHNLFRLSSRSSLEGFFYKPRADRELLAQYAKGLIATTGCPSGEIQTWLRIGDYEKARASAAEFRDIFGPQNYFLELMDHGLEIEKRVRDDLLRLAKDLTLPIIATNDSHYTYQSDAATHEVLLCVQSGKTMADPNRFKLDGEGYYLKSQAEMRSLWADKFELREACDNTLLIAERCDVDFTEGEGRYMSRFPCPPGEDETSWFVKEVEKGLRQRYPDGVSDEVRARADFETEVIVGKGYPGYFLVVADFMQWAKGNGIRTGVRGSGAGSMCAYALRITDLDPLEYKLTFERFLNPERKSMPDFDVDFDERRRGEVIRYVTEKYGSDRVAQIVTYGTIKAKQAVKDAGRVLGYPFAMGEKITKVMPPPVMGKDVPLEKIFDKDHDRYNEGGEFRALYEADVEVKKVVDQAKGLEGLKRQWGVHAAGVIMSSDPLLDIIPIMKREQDGAIITQFDYPTCEALGLVKMDFLGLRNLTVLGDAVRNVSRSRGIDLDLDALGADPTDPAAYELLSRGDTLGVFQLDGTGTRTLLRLMRPKRIQDIMATIALYRPGPMGINSHTNYALRRSGQQEVTYPHPEVVAALEPVLAPNYGLIVYQEDVIEAARLLAGYTLGRADMLRRAMGKKKKEVLDAEYVPFASGMSERGFSAEAIAAVWDALLPFADYGFGKAHAAAYAQVSYWTAYLKANYPAEYMAAVLTSVKDDKDKMAVYLAECRRMGINVLPPCVNSSEADFTPVGGDIRFGLTAVRNVGSNVVASVVDTRTAKGGFTDFGDYLRKVDAVVCNKRTIEGLIKGGAFDSLGHTRRGLMNVFEAAVDAVLDTKRAEAMGQFDLFGSLDGPDGAGTANPVDDVFAVRVPDGEWDKKVLLQFEREMLGLYVSDHPLFGLEHVLSAAADSSIAAVQADAAAESQKLTLTGILTGVNRRVTKAGSPWASATLEDLDGSIEVMFFPSTYAKVALDVVEDAIVAVKGHTDAREDSMKFVASDLTQLDTSNPAARGPVKLRLDATRCTPPLVDRLKDVLATHPGSTEVHLHLVSTNNPEVVLGSRVNPTAALMGDLKALLGPAAVSA